MLRILRTFFAIVIACATPVQVFGANQVTARINDVYVIHLIIDGTNYEAMHRVIKQGKMPTLKEQIIDRGATFTKAISTFPSTSTSAYQSFITGLLPGHAGIPHLQRFDRQKWTIIDYLSVKGHNHINGDVINLDALQNPDYANLDTPSTIFELLDGHPTLALYTAVRRGASIKEPKHVPLRAAWSAFVSNNIHNVDAIAFDNLMKYYDVPNERIPRYALVGLYSADVAGHFHGTYSGRVEEMLIQFDYFLRDFLALLEKQGIRDKTYFIISADHGMHNTKKLFRFREEAIERGIYVKPRDPRDKDYTLYAADRGVSSTHVYTRRSDGTFAPLQDVDQLKHFPLKAGGSFDLIDFILSLEPTELVIARDGEEGVVVYDRDGNRSRIACTRVASDDWCSYDVLTKQDPLHIATPAAKRLIDGRPHASQEWKHATANEYYTDAVIQLGTIFQDGRAGDLYIVPISTWGFRAVKKATHGSLIRDDMHIPLFISGPTVPRGEFGAMRTMDIFPLMTQWFGIEVPTANHDGVDPFQSYDGEDATWRALATLDMAARSGADLHRMTRRLAGIDRVRLRKIAKMELYLRNDLLRQLSSYIEALEKQKNDAHAPLVTKPAYVVDHLAIAKRIHTLTAQRRDSMKNIVNVLRK